ncbi:LPXTG cell wall anchor domain-containing protein [Oceanobacillus saliphilus]|uniref:LPXTG cell wall anchor domain-containing protein n=1 Tax=Oceanobacillus saliphilus TaxID=2925834 RepID=UPI00201E23AB|nr:LPXTG cell wall anchor domain-containing protein [Oceanobacillus saliphilus]
MENGKKKMRKADFLGFLSGLIAFALLILPFGNTHAGLTDDNDVRSDVYGEEENTREDVYGDELDFNEETDVTGDVYWDELDFDEKTDVTDDVYEAIGYSAETVAGYVYYRYDFNEFNIGDYIDSNGDVVANDSDWITFTPGLLDSLDDDSSVHLNFNGSSVQIPLSSIRGNYSSLEYIDFHLTPVNIAGHVPPLSEVFWIGMVDQYEWEYHDEIGGPVTLTFQIDPDAVENWENVVIKYMNEDYEFVDYEHQNLTFNTETGEITAEVYHWRTYAIFEEPGSETDETVSEDNKPDETHEEDEDEFVYVPEDRKVTDDVYYLIGFEDALNDLKDSNGNVVAENAKYFMITKILLDTLDSDKELILTNDGIKVAVPIGALKSLSKDSYILALDLTNVTDQYPNAKSSVYDFSLFLDYEYVENTAFPKPFEVTFYVDPKKVTNWNDIVLRYIDQDGKITDYKNQFVSINAATGEIVANIYHFSTYGIFEVPGSGSPTNNGESLVITGVNEDKNKDESSKGKKNAPESVNKVSSKSKSSSADETATDAPKQNQLGSILPDTATNTFNILAIGLIVLLFGLLLVIWKKPKKA